MEAYLQQVSDATRKKTRIHETEQARKIQNKFQVGNTQFENSTTKQTANEQKTPKAGTDTRLQSEKSNRGKNGNYSVGDKNLEHHNLTAWA